MNINHNSYYSIGKFRMKRGTAFGVMIITALLFFEMFNFSTTEFALQDLLGELRFLGIRWATILAIAFCGIDFAGIARIFTPEEGDDEPAEVWYLFGAWLLAATMNAMLTWWGTSIALLNSAPEANGIVAYETLLRFVPIFVAVLVWLSRVLLIGTFSIAGEKLFSQGEKTSPRINANQRPQLPQNVNTFQRGTSQRTRTNQPAMSYSPQQQGAPIADPGYSTSRQNEPTYHPIGMYARSNTQKPRTMR